jgi:hypothetical protein
MPNLFTHLISHLLPKARKAEVTVDVSEEDWGILAGIRKGLKTLNGKGTLELEIVGMSRLNPTVVLSIFDLLQNRGPGVKLHVHISTNLVDGSLIFPILADELRIRRGAWFQYATVSELEKKALDNDKDGEGWKNAGRGSRVNTVKEPSAITDYRAMSAILGEYMPLREFKGKRLPLEETLRDHNLLPDPVRDAALTRHFSS